MLIYPQSVFAPVSATRCSSFARAQRDAQRARAAGGVAGFSCGARECVALFADLIRAAPGGSGPFRRIATAGDGTD